MSVPSLKSSKVLVAMSGGVDSCVAAAMLAEQGHDIVGITMRVTDDTEYQSVYKPCCSAEMAVDARDVAERFGFEHYTLNYVEKFERHVIGDFTREYQAGRTPNPCVRCNQRLKFGTLYQKALELDAAYIATGHYVQVKRMGDRYAVAKAVDTAKDQSYVMAGLSQKQLAKGLFPLGGMTKEETRAKARELGLASADRPESQDICFIPDNDYRGFLERRLGPAESGPIRSRQGEVLGEHSGLMNYTIGQRRGLGIAAPRPLFVVALDIEENAVIVGHEEDTACTECSVGQVTWGGLAPREDAFTCGVQIRYHHEPVHATVTPTADGLHVRFRAPERALTPGQWAVMYDDEDRVLASGIIDAFTLAEPVS